MEHPENGLYVAKVTDSEVRTLHADEDAVCDAQTHKLFQTRDMNRASQEQDVADKQRELAELKRLDDRQVAKRRRRFWYMIKDALGLISAALLVYCTYHWGLLVAVGSIAGCVVAACCRVMNYFAMKGEKT